MCIFVKNQITIIYDNSTLGGTEQSESASGERWFVLIIWYSSLSFILNSGAAYITTGATQAVITTGAAQAVIATGATQAVITTGSA